MTPVATSAGLAGAIRRQLMTRTIQADPLTGQNKVVGLTEFDLAEGLLTSGAVVDAAALADDSTLDEVRADHERAVTMFGAHGVPTIVLPSGYALYGPVVVPAPTGAAALRLWDLVRGCEEFPHLYELRHPKTVDDLTHIAEVFGPYLSARDWHTVENPAP